MDSSIIFARWRQCAPPRNTCFLAPTRVHIPNGISIVSAVIAGLTIVTDKPTDRHTDRQTDHAASSVTTGRIYVVLRCDLKLIGAVYVSSHFYFTYYYYNCVLALIGSCNRVPGS